MDTPTLYFELGRWRLIYPACTNTGLLCVIVKHKVDEQKHVYSHFNSKHPDAFSICDSHFCGRQRIEDNRTHSRQ